MTTDGKDTEPLLLARVYEFVSLLQRGQTAELISFAIKNELVSSGKDPRALTPEDLITPTWHAFRRRDHGLMVDWQEGPIMSQSVSWAVEGSPFARAHDMLSRRQGDPEESELFEWKDESVEEGMKAFSQWLNDNRQSVCLLSMTTGADVYFSAYCPRVVADLAVAQSELAGLSTSIIDGVDMPELTALRAADALGKVVVGEHGFAPSATRVGRFVKEFNDDFSVVVQVGGGSKEIGVNLSVADHEMNSLSRTIMQDERAVKDFPMVYIDSASGLSNSAELTAAIDTVMTRAEALTEKEIRATVRKQTGTTTERRLLKRKWPKKAQSDLEARERAGRNSTDETFAAKQAAIARATRDYLEEHDIS